MRVLAIPLAAVAIAACSGDAIGPRPDVDVSGIVTDRETGTPIAGASVEVWFDGFYADVSDERLDADSSDAKGRIRMTLPPPRGYRLAHCPTLYIVAEADGYQPIQRVGMRWYIPDYEVGSCGTRITLAVEMDPFH